MPRHRVPDEQRTFARKLRGSQTTPEAALWHAVRNKRLGGWKFSRQVPIGPYVADFLCAEARLIVEIDGPLHENEEQIEKDRERDRYLQAEGFRVSRFRADEAIARILKAILTELESPPSPALRASAKGTLPRQGGG